MANDGFVLENVTVLHPGGIVAIRNLTWTVRFGETWAIVGPVASGKTTLLETLIGRHPLAVGKLHRPQRSVTYMPFQEDSGRFHYARHYYQQRFNFVEDHEDIVLADFLGPPALEWAARLGL